MIKALTLMMLGRRIRPALFPKKNIYFRWLFLHEKRCGGPKLPNFPVSLKTFRKSFWFGAPQNQSTFKGPALLGSITLVWRSLSYSVNRELKLQMHTYLLSFCNRKLINPHS